MISRQTDNMKVRPATVEDVLSYTGEYPPCQVRAVVGEIDGRIVGLGGLAFLKNGAVLAFMNAEPDVRNYKFALYRSAKALIQEAVGRGLTKINAIKADDIASAERFLSRLGFKSVGEDIYILGGH